MFHSMVPTVCLLSAYLANSQTVDLAHPDALTPRKLMYHSIRIRTAPHVSVKVRNRVSVSFSFTFLCLKLITSQKCVALCAPSFEIVHGRFRS